MTDRFIMESFWQSQANCASVALIKAAILRYGVNKIFKVEKRLNQLLITLKNGQLMVLSSADINRINRDSRIIFSRYKDQKRKQGLKRLKDDVRLCFAVIVRNLHLNGYDGEEYTESSAIRTLAAEGIQTDHIHSLLGLRRKQPAAYRLSQKHLKDFKRKKGILLYNDAHIVTVSGGFYDDYGKATEIKDQIPVLNGKKAVAWYELK
jgi:hypothetical protein